MTTYQRSACINYTDLFRHWLIDRTTKKRLIYIYIWEQEPGRVQLQPTHKAIETKQKNILENMKKWEKDRCLTRIWAASQYSISAQSNNEHRITWMHFDDLFCFKLSRHYYIYIWNNHTTRILHTISQSYQRHKTSKYEK